MHLFAPKRQSTGVAAAARATRRLAQTRRLDGAASDVKEQQADRAAERVMHMPQPATAPPGAANDAMDKAAPCAACAALPLPGSAGRPLGRATSAFMESRFGHDFSAVRVHADDAAAASAQALRARAYTSANHIVFDAGQYDPDSFAGKLLLAHELAHVVQQAAGQRGMEIQRQLYPPVPVMLSRACRRRRATGSASPHTGIGVTWNGNRIAIVARVQFSGPGATAQVANAMRQDIERVWNAAFSDGYASTCRVDMVLGGAHDAARAQIIVGVGGSVDQSAVLGSTMRFMYSGSPSDLVWSPSHEFAHLLGLEDRRTRPWWDFFDTQPETSEPGYERNIMGAIPGGELSRRGELALESRNIRDWLDQYASEPVPCADTRMA